MASVVDGLKMRTAIHFAPGATPIWFEPSGSDPTIVPIVWVPCPSVSAGSVAWLCGSYQFSSGLTMFPAASNPRHLARKAGWVYSTPLSRLATTIPVPSMPWAHTSGALTWAMFHSTLLGLTAAAPA